MMENKEIQGAMQSGSGLLRRGLMSRDLKDKTINIRTQELRGFQLSIVRQSCTKNCLQKHKEGHCGLKCAENDNGLR